MRLLCRVEQIHLADARKIEVKRFEKNKMCRVLLKGKDGSASIKIFFSNESVLSWVALRVGEKPSQISEALVLDYVRELTNLVSGHLRSVLSRCGIRVGASLPINLALDATTRERSPNFVGFNWSIVDDNNSIDFSIELDFADPNIFDLCRSALDDILRDEKSLKKPGRAEFLS